MLHEIDAQAHRLSALEWQAVAIGRVDNSLRREVEEVRQLLTANVESGRALGPDRAEYDRVDDVLHTFLAAMDEEFGLLQEGRLDEAHAVDDERVDPTFTLLHDLLEDAAVSSAQVAQQAQLTANLGTVSVLGAAVLFTVVLLVAFGRERRATDLAIAERQALARSEERFRALTLNAAELIAILADDGTITYLSPSAAALLGGDPEKRVGHAVGELIGPEDRHRIAELLGRPAPGGARSELRLRRADGTYLDVEAVWTDLRTIPAVNGIVLNARDITERKAVEAALRDSEEHLRQAQKMEAVGVLAGGIAHDFNNLLTVINGYSELILSLLPTDHPQRANLQEIERAGARAAALTSQLLAFSRRQVLQPRVLSLNTVVTDVGKLLQRLIGEDIELALDLQADLHPVKADEGQLGQVLLNLAANARDAMPTGGTLTVQTANVLLDDASTPPGRLDLEPGPYVMLGVSDTGIGMDVETQTRIFEPFFTTKEQGKGTGLGLSMVYGIVKQSDGDMLVHSEVGLGTTFKIYLPRAPSEDEAPPVVAEADGSLRGTGTVPVVEEEDGIRDLTRTVVDQRDTRS